MFLTAFLDLPWILSRLRSRTEIVFIVGLLILYFLVQTAREKWRVYKTRRWPTASATIVRLGYEKIDGGIHGVDYWKVRIDYTYMAANDSGKAQHSGEYRFNVTSEEQAAGAIAGLKDKTVSVHYNPSHVAEGVVWEDEVWDIWWETYWQISHPAEATAE
jgi:hypothetical protein